MSRAKTERLVNLTIALMAAARPLTVGEIGRLVEGYDPDDSETGGEAFRRMFERDKEELRELGIPLQTASNDPLHGDDMGYRIERSDYALPDLTLDPDEAAALGLAARLWSSAQLAHTAGSAIQKLAAGGADPIETPPGFHVRIDAREPAFDPLYDAVLARRRVLFGYRRPGTEPSERVLEPWGLTSWRGRWYVGGHDRDRDAPRVFRLSRITGDVRVVGKSGAYGIPEGVDLRRMVTTSFAPEPAERRQARIRISPGTAPRLRRSGTPTAADRDVFEVMFTSTSGFAQELVAYGPDVVVEEPAALRAEVIMRLEATLRSLARAGTS